MRMMDEAGFREENGIPPPSASPVSTSAAVRSIRRSAAGNIRLPGQVVHLGRGNRRKHLRDAAIDFTY